MLYHAMDLVIFIFCIIHSVCILVVVGEWLMRANSDKFFGVIRILITGTHSVPVCIMQ